MREHLQILLVEDSETDAKRIHTLLRYTEIADFTVHVATSLTKAHLLIQSKMRFDIVLMDMNLPDVTGIEAVASLTSKIPDVPVIVITGHDDYIDGLAAIQCGAQEYIPKSQLGAETLGRTIMFSRERARIMQKQARFYRSSMRIMIPDSANVAELQSANDHLISALHKARDRIKNRMPDVAHEIDQALHQQAVSSASSDSISGVHVTTVAKEVVQRMSMPAIDAAILQSEPKAVIADLLDRYSSDLSAGTEVVARGPASR